MSVMNAAAHAVREGVREPLGEVVALELPARALLAGLARALPHADKSGAMPGIGGVALVEDAGGVYAVATDRYSLAAAVIVEYVPAGQRKFVHILPPAGVKRLMAMLRGAGESETVTVGLDTHDVSLDMPARVSVQSSDTRIEFLTTGGEFLRSWRSLLTTEPSGCGPGTVTAEYLARFYVKVPGRGVVTSPYVTLVPNEEGKPLHVFIREDDRTVLHGLIMPVRGGVGGFPDGTTWAECALPS